MNEPLAFRMRPTSLNELVGQEHLIGEGMPLRRCIEQNKLFSMIFYGSPGCGKTTLAMILANELNRPYRLFNAVTGNKKELDTIFEEAKYFPGLVLIIDEVHRLNKDKQDLLLPHVENGLVTLIGATTSNPLFAINPAIRSRTHLFEVKPNSKEDVLKALNNAVHSEKGLNDEVILTPEAGELIANHCNGDIRYALNILEICATTCDKMITKEVVQQFSQFPNMGFDKGDDGHYDAVSAFQKAIRGSDVDAALYYLSRLILANDMDSIERRLIVTAYEDIGLGNPAAAARCVTAIDAAKRIGFPEARIILAHTVIDLCLSPKSKSAEAAIDAAMETLKLQAYPIPDYLKFTPVKLAEEDKYPYDRPDLWSSIQYLPKQLKNRQFYIPSRNSTYEKALSDNYNKLKQRQRSDQLSELKKK